jgi:hypothetical protein
MSDSRNDAAQEEARKRQLNLKIQRQLDEALEDSFPASDPVSIVTSHAEEDWGDDRAGNDPAGSPSHAASPKSPIGGR